MKKLLASIIFCLPLSSTAASLTPRVEFLREELRAKLYENPRFMGMKSQYNDEGAGAFCQKSSNWWVAWQGQLGDVKVDILPDESKIEMSLQFVNSSIEGAGFRTGGLMCWPSGGGARASLKDVRLSMSITKGQESADGKPLVHVESFKMAGLKLDRVDLSVPFFSMQNGTAPDWFNQFVERNGNRLIGSILSSSLSRRIDLKLSHILAEMIESFNGGISSVPAETMILNAR